MSIGPLELALIAVIVVLLFGGRRIPEAGRRLGTGVRSFVDGLRGIHEEEAVEPAKGSSEPHSLPAGPADPKT